MHGFFINPFCYYYYYYSCSLGVLQGQDVKFTPEFPDWKREALLSFHMTTYTKVYIKFDTNFWGDWEVSNNDRDTKIYSLVIVLWLYFYLIALFIFFSHVVCTLWNKWHTVWW